MQKKTKRITLVIMIIVLAILATIIISTAMTNYLLIKTQEAVAEQEKQTAKESMNFKIESYVEKTKSPTLQYLADKLCEDEEIEYVLLENQKMASLDKIAIGDNESIYTKLKQYPYEFEIDSSLQLASIDGIKIASTTGLTDEIKSYIDETIDNVLPDSNDEIIQYSDIIENSYGKLSITRIGNIVHFSGYYMSGTYTNNVNVIPERYMPDGVRNNCGSADGCGSANSGNFTTSAVSITADGKITTVNNMSWTVYNGTYEIISSD